MIGPINRSATANILPISMMTMITAASHPIFVRKKNQTQKLSENLPLHSPALHRYLHDQICPPRPLSR